MHEGHDDNQTTLPSSSHWFIDKNKKVFTSALAVLMAEDQMKHRKL